MSAYAKFSTQNSKAQHKFCAQYQILILAQENSTPLKMP